VGDFNESMQAGHVSARTDPEILSRRQYGKGRSQFASAIEALGLSSGQLGFYQFPYGPRAIATFASCRAAFL
jgi:hypothetical protein